MSKEERIIDELFPVGGKGSNYVVVNIKDAKGECKQCGGCCCCITLSTYKNVLRKWVEENRLKDKSFDAKALKYRKGCLFIVNNFVRVSRKEAKARSLPLDIPIYWCKQLEKKNGNFICKVHRKNKPSLCSLYPKYRRRTGEVSIREGCGYLG